jgi:hypothetical protein
MFARGALTIVFVTNNNPTGTIGLVVTSSVRDTLEFTGKDVLDRVDLTITSRGGTYIWKLVSTIHVPPSFSELYQSINCY